MGFLVALITHSMNLFVALKNDFQRELCDLWTFPKPNFLNYSVYMNILTKCKLIVKKEKNHGTVPFRWSLQHKICSVHCFIPQPNFFFGSPTFFYQTAHFLQSENNVMVSVLLSASVERFSVSRIRDFWGYSVIWLVSHWHPNCNFNCKSEYEGVELSRWNFLWLISKHKDNLFRCFWHKLTRPV